MSINRAISSGDSKDKKINKRGIRRRNGIK